MHTLLKSEAGPWPDPTFPQGTDLELEASRSRRRMMPVTVIYSVHLLVVTVFAWHASALPRALTFALGGVVLWTLMEYLVHRYILHVAFPPGKTWLSRTLHRLFDASHADHHAQPWDGYHINGHLDTLLVAVWAVPLSFLAPSYTASMTIAALFAAYAAEEWAHHAMHFSNYRWSHFQDVRRRHLFHHSRHGVGTAYGITSDFWDKVFGTRLPAQKRGELLPSSWISAAEPRE